MLIACVAVALAAGACGSTKSHQPQSQSVGTTGAGSGSTHRPSPFAVEATYTAKSLGLTFAAGCLWLFGGLAEKCDAVTRLLPHEIDR